MVLAAAFLAASGPGTVGLAFASTGPWGLSLAAGTTAYGRNAIVLGRTELGVRTLTPGLRYDSGPASWNVRLAAEHSFLIFNRNAVFDSASATPVRRRADRASLQLRHAWSDWNYLTADGNYLRSPDLLDTERGIVVPAGDYTRWDTRVAGALLRAEGGYGVSRRLDPGPSTAPTTVTTWHLRGAPLRDAHEEVYLGYRRKQLDVNHPVTVRMDVAAAGYRRLLGPGVAFEVEGGVSRQLLPDSRRRTRPDVAARLVSEPIAPSAVSLEVEVQGDSLASVSGLWSHVLGFGRGWIRAESVPDIDGGVFRAPTLDRRAAIGVEDTLSRANVVGLEMSYERVRALFTVGPTTSIFRSSLWLIRRIQPWLNGRVGWSYLYQPVATNTELRPLRRVRMDAELTFVGP